MKKFYLVFVLALVVVLAGCTSTPATDTNEAPEEGTEVTEEVPVEGETVEETVVEETEAVEEEVTETTEGEEEVVE